MKTLRNIYGRMQSIKRVMGSKVFVVMAVIGCLIPMAVYAASTPSPIVNGMYNFLVNTVINPDEVNINFQKLASLINTTGNEAAITVDTSTGNVGVGTANPNEKFQVGPYAAIGGADGGDNAVRVKFNSYFSDGANHAMESGNRAGQFVIDNTGMKFNYCTNTQTAGAELDASCLERMRIDMAGNIGIGTTNPQFPLDIQRSPNSTIRLHGSTIGDYNDNTLHIRGPNAVVFDGNDNVGIGTTTPASRLAVAGLPSAPPDSSGTRGTVCITNAGNMWVDEDGMGDCL